MKFAINNTLEESYIKHLAGANDGKSTISVSDKVSACSAHQHPISNFYYSAMVGLRNSLNCVSLGLLTFPFLNSSTRDSIIGSTADICYSCISSVKTIAELNVKTRAVLEGITLSSLETGFSKAFSIMTGVQTAANCLTKDNSEFACRSANYLVSVWDCLNEYPYILTGAVVVLAIGFGRLAIQGYEQSELDAEKNLIDTLTNRYEEIAAQIELKQSDPEMQKLAQQILNRHREIEQEIQNLELPNLSQRKIKQITAPVFSAARLIVQKRA